MGMLGVDSVIDSGADSVIDSGSLVDIGVGLSVMSVSCVVL